MAARNGRLLDFNEPRNVTNSEKTTGQRAVKALFVLVSVKTDVLWV
jgi:hypothetical protein